MVFRVILIKVEKIYKLVISYSNLVDFYLFILYELTAIGHIEMLPFILLLEKTKHP